MRDNFLAIFITLSSVALQSEMSTYNKGISPSILS
jgi:hypothetical protein